MTYVLILIKKLPAISKESGITRRRFPTIDDVIDFVIERPIKKILYNYNELSSIDELKEFLKKIVKYDTWMFIQISKYNPPNTSRIAFVLPKLGLSRSADVLYRNL